MFMTIIEEKKRLALTDAHNTLFRALILAISSVISFWLITRILGRADDIITASITTVVVMVVAAIGPQDGRREPILLLVDTAFGVAIGLGAAWISALSPRSASAPVSRDRH
jgi:hypothetical protein